MTLPSSQINPLLSESFLKLVVRSLQQSLPGTPLDECEKLSDADIVALYNDAAHLALSPSPESRNLAFEINSRLAEVFAEDHPAAAMLSAHLFARLGNFPAQDVVAGRADETAESGIGAQLALERLSRRIENTVAVGSSELILTDFQAALVAKLTEDKPLSISAPTSAGKSYALMVEIVSRISRGERPTIVYLVPTRALISQITQGLRTMLVQSGNPEVPIRCIPVPFGEDEDRRGSVYVLTQERLLSLIHSELGRVRITSLLVDEAQGIGIASGARGVLLQAVVDEVRAQQPQCRVRLAGPMIKNPDYLLSLFDLAENGDSSISEEAPVAQNVIRVERDPSRADVVSTELLREDGSSVALGSRELSFSFRSNLDARARFALSLPSPSGCTILYANTAYQAELLATKLAKLRTFDADETRGDVESFATFLMKHVHPQYALAQCLHKRVGFHHGSMPAIVREGVEDLVQRGELDYICCTSTLLQGVNLPAKDIIIENPQKGQGRPMRRVDFLNLAGRAGRLASELHGNVWCLNTSSWGRSLDDDGTCFEGERLHRVRSALEHVLADGGSIVSQLVEGDDIGDQEEDLAAATLAKLYTDYIVPERSLSDSPLATEENREALLKLESQIQRASALTLPLEIVKRNSAVVPFRLEELHAFLKRKPSLLPWAPVVPRDSATYNRLESIFKVLDRYLAYKSGFSYRFDTWLATQWIQNRPLREIIERRLARLQRTSPNTVVRQVIDAIEDRIRFRAVKHFRAYCNILRFVAAERGIESELPAAAHHFYLFLECGASDPITLNLIGLGLSRTTALLLQPLLPEAAASDPETCFVLLRGMNLRNRGLPLTCVREAELLLGVSASL